MVAKYRNSWLFIPIIWDVLSDKTIPRNKWGGIQSVTGWFSEGVFEHLNDKINNCDNMPDRICWELSNQQIFFTKDKECIVENIHKFVEQNKGYYKFDDGVSALEKDHVVERFFRNCE